MLCRTVALAQDDAKPRPDLGFEVSETLAADIAALRAEHQELRAEFREAAQGLSSEERHEFREDYAEQFAALREARGELREALEAEAAAAGVELPERPDRPERGQRPERGERTADAGEAGGRGPGGGERGERGGRP